MINVICGSYRGSEPATLLKTALESMALLDDRIERALSGSQRQGGSQDFAMSQSAVAKAEAVLDIAQRKKFDVSRSAILSVGGADGAELEHLLSLSGARFGVLLELDDVLADAARSRARRLAETGKQLRVLTGDATQKLSAALEIVEDWRAHGDVDSLLVTIHAVLHEFPTRGAKADDLELFLQQFLGQLPLLMVVREPCTPRDLPEPVYLAADCHPKNLARLAARIRESDPAYFVLPKPIPLADRVRMPAALAAETIVKLFYLDALHYELGERTTGFTRDELLTVFRRVFGTGWVSHEDLQSESFDHYWRDLGLAIYSDDMRELAKPQLHIRIVVRWSPRGGEITSPDRDEIREANEGQQADQDIGEAGARLPLDARSTSGLGMFVGQRRFAKRFRGATAPLDFLAPGWSDDALRESMEAHVGTSAASELVLLAREALGAIEDGDFTGHILVGEKIVNAAGDSPHIAANGLYFAGEGHRLLADLADGIDRARELENAATRYRMSLELIPRDPRPIRGLARVQEVNGNLGDALSLFTEAEDLAQRQLQSDPARKRSAHIAHELLRTSRHRVHCLLAIRRESGLGEWSRENRSLELQRLVERSETLHHELMPLFASRARWSKIEWFMGLVFLGRGWAGVNQPQKMVQLLQHALHARRVLLSADRTLTDIERANLRWWLDAASAHHRSSVLREFRRGVERLREAVESGSTREVLRCIDDIVNPSLPPWQVNSYITPTH